MIVRFLRELVGSGTVTAGRAPADLAVDREAVDAALADLEAHARRELPDDAPTFAPAVAAWAAAWLYDACRALAHRDVDADAVRASLAPPLPAFSEIASTHYSVDVVFRALPDVIRLARGVAADDPLTLGLLDAARAWPLSSVGVAGVGAATIDAFAGDACLLRLYADRVIERRDASRLDDARVVGEVRAMLGAYPPPRELAGRLTHEDATR